MIDLDLNDGQYHEVSESLAEADENLSVSSDESDGADESERNIFKLARAIAERGNRYRSLRRSSSIL